MTTLSIHHRTYLFAILLVPPLFWVHPHSSLANATPSFSVVLNETAPHTLTLTTDQDALALLAPFLNFDQDSSGLVRNHRGNRNRNPVIPETLAPLGIQFMQESAIFHWATLWRNALDQPETSTATSIHEKQKTLLQWVTARATQPEVNRVISLTHVYWELWSQPQPESLSWLGYPEFGKDIWNTYPAWIDSDSAWMVMAELEGSTGLRRRLESFWVSEDTRQAPWRSENSGNKEAFIGRFLHQQILPLLTVHLKGYLFSLQTQSERRAWETWLEIQAWTTQQQERKGLARICGTWQWMMHNHQNHGDHKTIMVYPPPSQYDRMDPKPAMLQVHGDTVYIRWEFPNGIIQEESLLLTEKDRMLSGTFVNNVGPHGNITGRRIAPCKMQ